MSFGDDLMVKNTKYGETNRVAKLEKNKKIYIYLLTLLILSTRLELTLNAQTV